MGLGERTAQDLSNGASARRGDPRCLRNAILLGNNQIVLILAMLGLMIGSLILIRLERADRRRSEARLRDSDARCRSALESMVHAVLTLDTTGTITDANGSALKLFGYEGRDLIGGNIDELTLKEDGSPTLSAYLRSLEAPIRQWGLDA